jgi:hypothetical protein
MAFLINRRACQAVALEGLKKLGKKARVRKTFFVAMEQAVRDTIAEVCNSTPEDVKWLCEEPTTTK